MRGLIRRSRWCWELPASAKPGMRVPVLIFTDENLLEAIREDESLEQLANAASLPGIVRAAIGMPDMHCGYGLPIGGVVATSVADGVVTPGGVGFDINCGVRLARTRLHRDELAGGDRLQALAAAVLSRVPAGVGASGSIRLRSADEDRVLTQGARWAVAQGYGCPEDLENTESRGCLEGTDPGSVSPKARERGRGQLGTLGSGNHFIELQYVDEIYDPVVAAAFGVARDQVTLMVHSGSRGLGHQVCTDHLAVMAAAARKYRIAVSDRQLACAPVSSSEAECYLAAMRCAANFAWANRQCLMALAGEVLADHLGCAASGVSLALVYDVAHNIVKFERHVVEGREVELAVHRKGATRALPAGHPEIPTAYRAVGQPVVVPGDMGRCSYLLVGQPAALDESFGSSAHGAGRLLSRSAARRAGRGRAIGRELEQRYGVIVRSTGRGTLAEEMPEAYKDVGAVVAVLEGAGLARRVARLRPLVVVKG